MIILSVIIIVIIVIFIHLHTDIVCIMSIVICRAHFPKLNIIFILRKIFETFPNPSLQKYFEFILLCKVDLQL